MNVSKAEKIWLIVSITFFCLYNLPGVPAYGDDRALIIHGLLTMVPLWITTYCGMYITSRKHKLKEEGTESH